MIQFLHNGFTYRTNDDASVVEGHDGKKWNRTYSLGVRDAALKAIELRQVGERIGARGGTYKPPWLVTEDAPAKRPKKKKQSHATVKGQLFDGAPPAVRENMIRDVQEMVRHETGRTIDEADAAQIARTILARAKTREALYRVSTARLRDLVEELGGSHHATKKTTKKSPAQLDREIAEAMGARGYYPKTEYPASFAELHRRTSREIDRDLLARALDEIYNATHIVAAGNRIYTYGSKDDAQEFMRGMPKYAEGKLLEIRSITAEEQQDLARKKRQAYRNP